MSAAAPRRLSLGAEDSDDLEVLSAVVQDATVRVGDMAFEKRRRRFAMMLNRFVWEDGARNGEKTAGSPRRHFRVRAGLHFDGVLGVASTGIDPASPGTVLGLLAITHSGERDGSGTIELVFAGNAAIRLSVECIDCYLRDLGAPWPTANLPDHALDAPATEAARPDGRPARDED